MDIPNNVDYHSLAGRVVIITGGGQGIGRTYAHHFAAQGAVLVIAEINAEQGASVAAEINAEQGASVAAEIEADGGKALFVETDVGDLDSAEAMAQAALDGFGRIDAWSTMRPCSPISPTRLFARYRWRNGCAPSMSM